MRKFKREVLIRMIEGNAAERKFICEQEFMYFCAYYFTDFFKYKTPDFHFEGYDDLKFENSKYLIWMWFREAAKTSIIKMFITYCVVMKKKRYILYDCYDKANSERHLYDIATWLQTNKRLISDYGQLFYEPPSKDGERSSKKKSISEFITANRVKIEAVSTQESVRGRIYDDARPDLIIFDDFENEITKNSYAVTDKIMRTMGEAITGLSGHAQIIFLCNYISEIGSVQTLLNAAQSDPSYKVRRVDVVQKGQIMWPDKYEHSDIQAMAKNMLILDPEKKKVSLEAKKRTLNKLQSGLYEQEMLNQPIVKGSRVYSYDNLKKRIELDVAMPTEVVGDWKVWGEYNPSHAYAIGGDVGGGVGRDSCAAVLIDFTCVPRAKVVAVYANNRIDPTLFAYELKNMGNRFGACLVAPEVNNMGHATVAKLKEIYKNIYYREDPVDRVNPTMALLEYKPKKYGWETNGHTKGQLIFELKQALDDNLIDIPSLGLLNELLSYSQADLEEHGAVEGMTRHFDLLMALAIAWRMRNSTFARGAVNNFKRDPQFDRHSII